MTRKDRMREYYQQMVRHHKESDPEFTYALQGAALAIALTITVWGLTEIFLMIMKG